MKKLSLITLMCLLGTVFSFAQSKDETAVANAVENLRKVMIDPTQESLEGLVMNELSYGHSGGNIEDKAAFVEALVSGKSDFKSIEIKNQTIQVVGNTAVVRHQLFGDTSNNGQAGTVKLAVLTIWQKHKGKWLLLARQAIKITS